MPKLFGLIDVRAQQLNSIPGPFCPELQIALSPSAEIIYQQNFVALGEEMFREVRSDKAGPTRHCHFVHLQVFHFSPSGSSRLRAFYLNTKVQDQKPRSSTGQGLGKISNFLKMTNDQ